nr:hypothetical protein [uncultured Moraxella sp.]
MGKNNQFSQKIWYLQNLESGKTYSLVIMVSGSGSTFGNYEAVFVGENAEIRHNANWQNVNVKNLPN